MLAKKEFRKHKPTPKQKLVGNDCVAANLPGTVPDHSCCPTLMEISIPMELATFTKKSRLGLYLPLSIREMLDFFVEQSSASPCCVRLEFTLAARSCEAINVRASSVSSGTIPSIYRFFITHTFAYATISQPPLHRLKP